jgi:N-methylhydantoinase B
MISPVFINSEKDNNPAPQFFVASRAHHADVGGMSPGSMPLSTELFQEGIIIPPIKLINEGKPNDAVWKLILRNVRTPGERLGDLTAQLAAHTSGSRRIAAIVDRYGLPDVLQNARSLIDYAERMTRTAINEIPDGTYPFIDYLDDDGQGNGPLPIRVNLKKDGDHVEVDFTGTTAAAAGNVNAVPAIVESAVAYCIRCVSLALLDLDLPMNAGMFKPITVKIPQGSLLNPDPPHAVAAGNVETSQRVVDVVMGALSKALPALIPAASQGTMNNLTFGGSQNGSPFAYYETIGGGAGAGPKADGAGGIHVHMSNTLNTPIEALEYNFPLQIIDYSLRKDSGGKGENQGGDGITRSIKFLVPVTATVNSDRRVHPPYGLADGNPGLRGQNSLIRDGKVSTLPGKFSLSLDNGDILQISTPGGGGWGKQSP